MVDNKNRRTNFHLAGRYLALLILLGLAVHIFLPQISSLEHSLRVVQQMAIWAVVMAFICQALSYVSAGYLLRSVAHLSKRVLTIFKSILIVLASYSLGMAAGGLVGAAAATYRWLQKEGASSESASIASTMPGFFNSVIILMVSSAGLIHLLAVHQLNRMQVLAFTLILLSLIIVVFLLVWGFRHRQALLRLAHQAGARWARIRRQTYEPATTDKWLIGLFETWEIMLKGGWREPFLAATMNVVFDMLTLYFLFIAAGNPISLAVLLAGYGLPLVLGRAAFFLPGGLGVIEGTMVALYDGLGVPDPISVVVVLAYRLLSFWLPLSIGFLLIGFLEKNPRSQSERETAS